MVLIVLSVLMHVAGALVAFSVYLDAQALVRNRVTVARKPLVVYRGAVKTLMLAIYVGYLSQQVWGVVFPRGLTAFGTAMVFFLIGLEWVVTWYVDRNEYYQLVRGEANRMLEKVEDLDSGSG